MLGYCWGGLGLTPGCRRIAFLITQHFNWVMLNQIPQRKINLPRCSIFCEIKGWKMSSLSTRWHEGKHHWKPAGILTPRVIPLLEEMVSDRRSHQRPYQCSPGEAACPGRGGIGSVGLGHLCLSPPVSGWT